MRRSLERIVKDIQNYGNDFKDKDIALRSILLELLTLIDQALPIEVEPD